MTDKELDNIHQLLSSNVGVELGFMIAEGFGFNKVEFIRLLWDEKNEHTTYKSYLELGNFLLIKFDEHEDGYPWRVWHSPQFKIGSWICGPRYINQITAIEWIVDRLT